MKKISKNSYILIIALLINIWFPVQAIAEFYKYTDKNGKMHFVDDASKIPPEYQEDHQPYKERYDNLSEQERSVMLKKDEEEAEKERQREIDEEIKERILENQERIREAALNREKYLKSMETKVLILGNQVIVPVTLGYRGAELTTELLLDTGASIIAIHNNVAEQLKIDDYKKSAARIASGKTIGFKLAVLDYIKVGPFEMKDVHVGIINHKGFASAYKGLLGMNFLRNLKYEIDFQKQVIRWKP